MFKPPALARALVALTATAALVWGAAAGADAVAAPLAYRFTEASPATVGNDVPTWNRPGLGARPAPAAVANLPDGTAEVLRLRGERSVVIASKRRFSRFGDLSINARGQVAFEGSPSRGSGEGIFRREAGDAPGPAADAIVKIAGTRDFGDFDFVNAGPSMNAQGRVAFIGERIVAGRFVDGVYAGDGGAVTAVYDADGPFSDFTGNPSLNDAGVVAFLATRDDGVGGLFLGAGGTEFTTVADDRGVFTSVFGFSDPSLNRRGEVAFRAGTNSNPGDDGGSTGEGIFLYAQGRLRTVWHGGVGDHAFLGDPALDDRGRVAFVVEIEPGTQMLVTGADLANDRVVGSGDLIGGRTVSGITFGREGWGRAGALVFGATFSDGTSGVFVATPLADGASGR